MVLKLDHLDLRIISQLNKDARISITDLAKKVKSTRLTVSKRLKRLKDEKLVSIRGGLNLGEFGFRMASVGLEVTKESTRKMLEANLRNCPRVLNLFRTPEKANIHAIVWGEDEHTIKSTIESFRDLENVDIVYSHYLGTPIHGNIIINLVSGGNAVTPCGKKCADCYRYNNAWCQGCPISKDYKNPLLKEPKGLQKRRQGQV